MLTALCRRGVGAVEHLHGVPLGRVRRHGRSAVEDRVVVHHSWCPLGAREGVHRSHRSSRRRRCGRGRGSSGSSHQSNPVRRCCHLARHVCAWRHGTRHGERLGNRHSGGRGGRGGRRVADGSRPALSVPAAVSAMVAPFGLGVERCEAGTRRVEEYRRRVESVRVSVVRRRSARHG